MSDDERRDDDWFESAVQSEPEDDTDADDTEREESTDAERDDGPFEDADGDSPFGDAGGDSPFGDAGGDSPFGDAGGDSPFGDAGGDSPFEDAGGDSPFGDAGGDSPFDESGGDGLFDDDFASAFESAGDPGGGGGADFEDEDFDSDIPRIDVGIDGLDRMIQGGIPRRHLLVTIGSAGTGKTTFGLQFLHHGLQNGESCVFITLEQSHEAIMDTADDRGWGFEEYEAEGRLAVIDLDPVEMANSLDNIRGELPDLIEDFGADRLVLDSVSLLEMMYDKPSKRRTEVFDFTRSLKDAGVTTMLTSEANEDNPYASRYGVIEYLTDGVFILQYVRSETRETRLAVEIQKIRNANHSRETKPYEITMDGISVYQQANIF
ncbi:KaiC domain-containing protein [Halomicroarcula sp. S1AR25-4]|uniref:KaiC domain-containing protein n=1 Tax=Haloarcula sp. S1AR25-4 TaxID=2950538 RepID=UPI002874C528|nr:KaiC domain-containing protein [Halomicroarcula sp. S1AR25-4]MDS0278277.1 KaiC domain-containing protein [Halomicroarcula sp. S1AR25-4]